MSHKDQHLQSSVCAEAVLLNLKHVGKRFLELSSIFLITEVQTEANNNPGHIGNCFYPYLQTEQTCFHVQGSE